MNAFVELEAYYTRKKNTRNGCKKRITVWEKLCPKIEMNERKSESEGERAEEEQNKKK